MRALWSDSALVLGYRSTGLGKMVQKPQGRFHAAGWRERLRDHPTRLKLVLSDSTARRVILTKPSQIILYFQKIDGFFMKIRVTSNLIFFYLFGWRAWKILAEGDKSGTLVCRQG